VLALVALPVFWTHGEMQRVSDFVLLGVPGGKSCRKPT